MGQMAEERHWQTERKENIALMNRQPSRTLVDATIVPRTAPVNATDVWGFHLTFQTGEGGVEDIRAWVERIDASYVIQRSMQYHPPGPIGTSNATSTRIAELGLADQVEYLLKELFYLWTRDDRVDASVRPLVQHNLQYLRQQEQPREEALASAAVYMYDVIADDRENAPGEEVLRVRGNVSTKAALRRVVLELPPDCSSFEIHLEARGQIIGNAAYRVDHTIDPQTGKRTMLLIEGEYGACKNIHQLFDNLYNTEEQFNRSVDLT